MADRDEILRHISFLLYNRRMDMGLTQKEMAAEIGVEEFAYKDWERRYTTPRATALCDLADYFEISVDELLGRGGNDG